jgi:hypothetical protein
MHALIAKAIATARATARAVCVAAVRAWLWAVLGFGLAFIVLSGYTAIVTACATITLFTVIAAVTQTYSTSLRLWARQKLELVRANIDLMVVSLLAVPMFAISASITLLALRQRLQAFTHKAAPRRTARVGHRRIAHIALTARVVPAPIARA